MKRTDLVFRTVGERTADLSLELAIEHIRPGRVEVVDNVRPFSAAVQRQLAIDHDCDQVVYVDADCLILDDLVPFLERNHRPYVDCFVTDRFRGRIHCGVHVTAIDVVRAMREIEPPTDDEKYVLRPESRLRNLALKRLKMGKEFRNFNVLHDHFQFYRDIYAKYALRELRSRTAHQRKKLEAAEGHWASADQDLDQDVAVARHAVEHTRRTLPAETPPDAIARYIERLPDIAAQELRGLGVAEKPALGRDEVEQWVERHPLERYDVGSRPRVFGIGLSRTGTRSLTMALHVLGWDTVHYPTDAITFEQLAAGDYDLAVLEEYSGVTDITVAPYYAQLDRHYPGSKFVLTVRDREPWLRSCRNHWKERSAFEPTNGGDEQRYMEMRRLLRAAVFGCYSFNEERFAFVYEQHLRNVMNHFRDRPSDLLVLDICGGQGWDLLCPFLGVGTPTQPFPHRGARLTSRLEASV